MSVIDTATVAWIATVRHWSLDDEIRYTAREVTGAFSDFSPMLAEFIAQVRHRTDVLYEARERGFIAKLNPQTFESRHL
jgi:hypothetical protein